jgi:hypothetical protein
MYIKALQLALKQSNLDKAALRDWTAEVNKINIDLPQIPPKE